MRGSLRIADGCRVGRAPDCNVSGPLAKSSVSSALAKILDITSQCLEHLAEIEADLRWLEQREANFPAAAGGRQTPVKRPILRVVK